jgi:Sec-independent protein secretion pathway component TatC
MIESRGQIFGFVAFLVIAVIGGAALYLGQVAVAITCFTTFVLGVVGMFITGRQKRSTSDEH